MSNSTSQNGQGKIKKKGSCTRNLPLYLLMIPGLLYLIYYDAHSKGASAWMHLIVSHAMIVYTNDRI